MRIKRVKVHIRAVPKVQAVFNKCYLKSTAIVLLNHNMHLIKIICC